jgi:hypothetical protein
VQVNTAINNNLGASTFRYRGGAITVNWTTNDTHIPIGVNLLGADATGNIVSNWAGPFNSADNSATFTVPTQQGTPYVSYKTISLSVYPYSQIPTATAVANINPNPFSKRRLDPLVIVNPSLNAEVRIYNPGVSAYLQVRDMYIYNDLKQNIVSDPAVPKYAAIRSSQSIVYDQNFTLYGAQNALDNNPSSYFRGGFSGNTIDQNASMIARFSTISASRIYDSTILVSSLVVYPGPTVPTGLSSMALTFSNYNDPNIPNGLFYSTIQLTSSPVCVFSFNG